MAINKTRCIGCQTCVVRMQDAERRSGGPADGTALLTEGGGVADGAQGDVSQSDPCLSALGVPALREPGVPARVPDGRHLQGRAQGRVEIDYDKCIGCRMCMAACPYNVRSFNWDEPVHVPDFAYGDANVEAGACRRAWPRSAPCARSAPTAVRNPRCVQCCPMDARIFGDLDDPGFRGVAA